jgi:cation:H+ antiporter
LFTEHEGKTMGYVESQIVVHPWLAWVILVVAFTVLAKSADLFVESAVALANRMGIPKVVIGIVLVSFATTMPEVSVSFLAALRGNPEMAMGNAVGSVICNEGVGLALTGFFAVSAVHVIPRVVQTSGAFLFLVMILCFGFVLPDGVLSRWEGAVLVILLFVYFAFLFREHKLGRMKDDLDADAPEGFRKMGIPKMVLFFILGLAGIIVSSNFIVVSATAIAKSLGIPEVVIALTLVAIGTSIPELATCITSARKGHGDIAVGNIIGANILNICWVAGASSLAHDLKLETRQIWFMFPFMFLIVGTRLFMLMRGYILTKAIAITLFLIYLAYLAGSLIVFPPS